MKTQAISNICVIYVGRTEGEHSQWGKVGRVKGEWRLRKRTKEYKVADRDFWFICRAAFQVSLPTGTKPHAFETSVQNALEMRGLKRRGEQFLPPESSMELLVREVEDVIKDKGVVYQALDVSALREHYEKLNAQVRAELDGIITATEPCPYRTFLDLHSAFPWGDRLRRRSERDRELIAMGHILRDVAAGSGISELRLDFGQDTLVVYPPTLPEAIFQAGAEADLSLSTTLRFTVKPTSITDLPGENSLTLVRCDSEAYHVDQYEVPGPFMWEGEDMLSKVRFRPEHLACLGQIGMDDEPCYFCGLGTRAPMPMDVMRLAEADPKLLPGVRFWLGLMHAERVGIHLLGYRLPAELDWLLDGLDAAADALAAVGRVVDPSLRGWVDLRLVRVQTAI